MCIDGDVLELDIDMDLEEVKALKTFVKDRLAYIEQIVLLRSNGAYPLSSALFSLLFCIKQTKPSLKIDGIDAMSLELGEFGTMYWMSHE